MRILFLMEHPGYARHYAASIQLLADRGHDVRIGFVVPVLDMPDKKVDLDFARELIDRRDVCVEAAPERSDRWSAIARISRLYVDYLRYYHPDFADTPKLARRAGDNLPKVMRAATVAAYRFGGYRATRMIGTWFEALEKAYPADPRIERYLDSCGPDAVVVTPLVEFGSRLVDYVSSAKRRGIPSAVCVASWDNLTNKGLLRVVPDRMIAWNEFQGREAVDYHGVATESVVITGAQTFDPWFDRIPATTFEEFRERVGLSGAEHLLLYLCSSSFICSVESEARFVRSWLEQLRSRPEPELREAGVVVRPHPLDGSKWDDVELAVDGLTVVWPPRGVIPLSDEARSDFYDSLHHCSAVVGVNTSALIEAGIVGRPVHCMLAPEFRDTQEGTIHFRHLQDGGLLRLSSSFDDHFDGVAAAITYPASRQDQVTEFIGRFVRPNGLDVQCAPLVADAIEGLLNVKTLRWNDGPASATARLLLSPVATALKALYERRRSKRVKDVR